MSTRIDLANRVKNFLPNTTYYQNFDFNDSIQDGLDEICAFSGCVYASATLSYLPNKTYYDMLGLLPNYIGVIAIFSNPIKRWLFPTSLRKLAEVRWDWETAIGTPYWFVPVSHRYVAIWMKPGSPNYGTFNIFYKASGPSPLTDTTAIPIPDDHIQALDSYVVTDLWEQNQEFNKATSFFQQSYQKDLDNLRTYIQSKTNIGRQQRLMD